MTGGMNKDKSVITFDQFLHAALHHELMDGLIDLFNKTDLDEAKKRHKIKEGEASEELKKQLRREEDEKKMEEMALLMK